MLKLNVSKYNGNDDWKWSNDMKRYNYTIFNGGKFVWDLIQISLLHDTIVR